jgi:hypothetical protein
MTVKSTIPQVFLVVRGIPGARKSTLARILANAWLYAAAIVSEDDYWTAPDGGYYYTPKTVPLAFAAMYESAREAIGKQAPLIVMATAALSLDDAEMQAVIGEAKQAGYSVFPLVLQRDPAFESDHNVSSEEMDRFRREMQHGLETNFNPNQGNGIA